MGQGAGLCEWLQSGVLLAIQGASQHNVRCSAGLLSHCAVRLGLCCHASHGWKMSACVCRYVPGAILKEGINEVILLEFERVPEGCTGEQISAWNAFAVNDLQRHAACPLAEGVLHAHALMCCCVYGEQLPSRPRQTSLGPLSTTGSQQGSRVHNLRTWSASWCRHFRTERVTLQRHNRPTALRCSACARFGWHVRRESSL